LYNRVRASHAARASTAAETRVRRVRRGAPKPSDPAGRLFAMPLKMRHASCSVRAAS